MQTFFEKAAILYSSIATAALLVSAFLLFSYASIEIVNGLTASGEVISERVPAFLDGIGLVIIGFAIVEAARFIAEEVIFRERALRTTRESRQSMTKFVTIIVIAASLEALVMVFKAGRDHIAEVVYPAFLLFSIVTGLVALGVYQWLSSRVQHDGG